MGPVAGTRIYKDECVYTYDTPESSNGLYICLNTFLGFSKNYAQAHHKKTGNAVFLHVKRTKRPVTVEEVESPQKITRLAIGVDGGFQGGTKPDEYDEEFKIVIL